ncbi:hypothetical protein HMPREF0539_0823 [Lacticaseibacillus rhamnosus LMS2-1]|uniref:Uncharacterized protein n=1 Tax=Lacticaseibacillus rhamnosus (strain LMS2-1) TaxID=525361 RepID=C2JV89_LACRM|nr:conserved hypothetical protein [Lacticaseibacillus rhamnosus ATCC 8530]EEN81051.1 hypothetical protein HMPREF0539_0823 [Lacticaseibacillus rhamnosus LMS2-1]
MLKKPDEFLNLLQKNYISLGTHLAVETLFTSLKNKALKKLNILQDLI